MVTHRVVVSVQLFAKITGSILRVLLFHRRTILDLKLQRKLVYSSVYFAVIYTSVNVLTRTVSPLRIIYGVVSNPCVSICIIHGPELLGGGWVGGGEGPEGMGREKAKAPQVNTQGSELPTGVLTIQPGRRDIIPVMGRIPCPIGVRHRCQCVGHGLTRR